MYEIGAACGRHYSVNVPLREGIDDQSSHFIFGRSPFRPVNSVYSFQPIYRYLSQ